jgi:hypothetical protein
MSGSVRFCMLLAVGAAIVASTPAFGASGGAEVHAAKSCSIRGQERSLGPSYVTSLSVSRTSCATGKAVVKAYHSCRFANGGKRGHCRRKVMGYSCSEKRSGIKVQFNGKVTCKKGSARVNHSYTQNT